MKLCYEDGMTSVIHTQIIEKLKKYRHVIIFGAGESGEWALGLLRDYHIEPVCFCDNYAKKWGTFRGGLVIQSFEDAINEYRDAAICIASICSEEILEQICEYDVALSARSYNILSTMAWETSHNLYESSEMSYIRANERRLEALYQRLDDDRSREVLEGILNYRLTRKYEYLKKIKSNEKIYFDDSILGVAEKEYIAKRTIIDGGSFDGDTVEALLKFYRGGGRCMLGYTLL